MSELSQSSSYYLNFYALPVAVVSTLIFAVGAFVFLQNKKAPTNVFFFLFCLTLNLWLYGISMVYCSKDPEVALTWYRWVTFLGVVNISPMVYTFSVHWLGLYEKQKKFVKAAFIVSPIFYFLAVATPYGMPKIQKFFWGYYPMYGIAGRVFIVFFFGYFLAAFYNFFSQLSKETDSLRKKQIGLLSVAFLISIIGSVDYLPKLIPVALYPFGYLCVLSWTLIMAYLIVRYRVMDIQTVIHKTIMWFVTSSVIGAPLVILFYVLRDWFLNIHPFIFLFFVSTTFILFALYGRHVQPQIDHLFQRRQWDLIRALERFTDELVHFKSLDEVVTHILNTVKTIFYVRNISLLIRKEDTNAFAVAQIGGRSIDPKQSLRPEFLKWLEANDVLLIEEYVSIDPRFHEIAAMASEYFENSGAKICVPMIANQKLIGVLNIGQKDNLKSFRGHEISFLSDFRRSAAIALSNSLHLIAMQENLQKWNEELEKKVDERTKQLQETQAQLIQAEKLATIGTLAGGVAHEINNPLTAVLTNAQMLKMDAKGDDLESISLIEEGAKRCQIIIQKLMKYARKSTGEEVVGEVDVNKVIDTVISFLQYQLKQENIALMIEKSDKRITIHGNANELEQVVTNLILNAKDAIKQSGRDGKIQILTAERNGSVDITVSDNGIGIPSENLSKIFDPFFTTKEIGKGTGLGLSIAHGIVRKHFGKIEVLSGKENGAIFKLSFPKKSQTQ